MSGHGGQSHLLTEREAFEAMRHFLEAYWERSLKNPDERLVHVLSDIDTTVWADDAPGDPAAWNDWLSAVRAATER